MQPLPHEQDPFTPQERQINDLLNEIERQTSLQEAATEFFETVYHLAFLDEAAQIGVMKNTVWAMYVKAENCRTEIENLTHQIREILLPEQTRKMNEKHPYKPIEPIQERE